MNNETANSNSKLSHKALPTGQAGTKGTKGIVCPFRKRLCDLRVFVGHFNTISFSIFFLWGALTFAGCKKNPPSPPPPPQDTTVKKGVPSGAADGVTFINNGTSAIFNLYAPGKKSFYLIGDFNNWQVEPQYKMTNTPDGDRWWIEVDGLDPGVQYGYQYYIDSSIKVADPYSHEILDPNSDQYIPASVYPNLKPYPVGKTTGYVSVIEGSAPVYQWKVTNFQRPAPKNLVIYELLVRDFVATHSYQTLTDTLGYLERLGVNAIELMPVNEFEGNDSWGYNPNFMMALDKYYGTPNAYKAFIDACHAHGIAVIQDIVLEDQFGSSPMIQMYATPSGTPAADNPWFDTANRHPDAVGYQLNHESPATQYYAENVMKYWMQEYHIDGFRFDQAKGFTQTLSTTEDQWSQYDPGRVQIWQTYHHYIDSLDPTFYTILEYFASNQEEAVLANQGMMMWTNLNYNANQATMGYSQDWDLSGLFYDRYGFSNPYGLVAYFESHDEERLQYKNEQYGNSAGNYNVKDLGTGLERDGMAAAFLFSAPGPKMLWQFGERGYDISINYNGRLGDKPPLWNYMNDSGRVKLYNIYAKMIHMKINNPVFTTTKYQYTLSGAVKTIQLNGSDGTNVEVIGNFDVAPQTTEIYFPSAGAWYDNLNGDSIHIPTVPYSMTLAPGEYHVYSNVPLKQ
ncbi:MAG: alpha-amylase [Chitinophagaceae bacterium]|nr:MAG: alpha-amylase [Chitinophagaceae bacterium]